MKQAIDRIAHHAILFVLIPDSGLMDKDAYKLVQLVILSTKTLGSVTHVSALMY